MLLCDLQSVQALDIVSGPDWLARQFEGGGGCPASKPIDIDHYIARRVSRVPATIL